MNKIAGEPEWEVKMNLFLELIKAVVLGIVQGITEWLPISSTGHMILFNEFLQMDFSDEFVELFIIVIQFGSILAVLLLYFHKLNPFSPKKSKQEKTDTMILWSKVLVACIPAGIIGILFNDLIKATFYNSTVIAFTLIIYGVGFILVESKKHDTPTNTLAKISYKDAILIGGFQVLALIPGTSRSGATILGATLLGLSRTVASEFSFFLAIPVMLGASALDIIKFGFDKITFPEISVLLTGMIVAFVVSMFAIRFLMSYIRKHDFKAFGYYRIVLGILVLVYFAFLAI